ncbi:MAG: undecaprenyl-diphosphate phosphatase [Gammaproteobacteria bacterium]|nr:undecaprenyl-diphosphate phosphatase [Gammaproteobacteria bacterium]
MSLWEAIVLGVLQGATEFLPVSSSGHLVIGQELLSLRIPGVRFEVVVHLATLLAVLVVYRRRILSLALGVTLAPRTEEFRYAGLILVATLPAAALGFLFGDAIGSFFDRPAVVGVSLLLTGSALYSTRWALRRPLRAEFGVRAALLVGLAQALALVPGISRSGATLTAALWLGVAPLEAAAFSFLMSVPAIAGAGVLEFAALGPESAAIAGGAAWAGFAAAAAAGILAIRFLINLLERGAFPVFSWYCWGAGLAFLAWLGAR